LADGDDDVIGHTYPHADFFADANANFDSNLNPDPDVDADPNSDSNGHSDALTDAHPNQYVHTPSTVTHIDQTHAARRQLRRAQPHRPSLHGRRERDVLRKRIGRREHHSAFQTGDNRV
jgi:hypothetical protein